MDEPTYMNHAQLTAWNDQEDRKVTEKIREYGCWITAVHSDGPPVPCFAYTTGLFGIGHPELIVFGMSDESAGNTLNWFFDRIRGGGDLMPGQVIEIREANGTRFYVEDFPDPGGAVYTANRHYKRPREYSVPAYQLTYDIDGAFPWEAGYPKPPWFQPRPGEYDEWA